MKKRFFAASNSCDGFKNYYEECFARADRLYIIKGGPGTGKSTLMKRLAHIATARGYDTEHYFCSSDHTSYDGILINTGREYVGAIDGTLPHLYAEKLPGLCEELVNTGMFWSRGVLAENGDKIRALTRQKGKSYNEAYFYLRAYGNLSEVVSSYVLPSFDGEKAEKFITGIFKNIKDGEELCTLNTPINGIGMLGEAHLDTLEGISDRIYLLCGLGGGEVLRRVYDRARQKRKRLRACPSAIAYKELDGVYLEDEGIWIVRDNAVPAYTREKFSEKIRIVNMQRFVSLSEQAKKEIKYSKRLMSECVEGALGALSRAGEAHFTLEEIYKGAMDFGALETYVSELCEKII